MMTLQTALTRLWYLFLFPLVDPPTILTESKDDATARLWQPEDDGRYFAWVRQRGAKNPVSPVIVYDKNIGGKMEYVGNLQMLKPHEYGDDLDALADRYPAPPITE